jgi:hypothetical protein
LQVASDFTEAVAAGDTRRALELMQFLVLLSQPETDGLERPLRLEKHDALELLQARMGGIGDAISWQAHDSFGVCCGQIDYRQSNGGTLRFLVPMLIEFGLVTEMGLQVISLAA